MKKIILIVLIFCFPVFSLAGTKKRVFKKEKIQVNQDIIAHYKYWFDSIESVDGETVIEVPYEKEVFPDAKVYIIHSTPIFYEVTIIGSGKKITIFNTKCKYYEFDFTNKIIKPKTGNDQNSFMKPKDLKAILEKYEGINLKEPIR